MAPRVRLGLTLLLALVVAFATASAPLGMGRALASSCGQEVTHDLRSQEAVAAFNESSAVVSSVSNTEVTVVDATGFIRVEASNPNGYCVRFRVEISPEIVDPATLGEVDAINSSVTASWSANQNLTSGETYTVVEFTLPARSSAVFAPSEARIVTLEWTSKAEQSAGMIESWLGGLFGGGNETHLAKKTYTITANNTTIVTVSKSSGEGRRITDWYATYTLNGETHPVVSDAAEPVFYTETEDRIKFMFNNKNARVRFTANPSPIDRLSYRLTATGSILDQLQELNPFVVGSGGIAS